MSRFLVLSGRHVPCCWSPGAGRAVHGGWCVSSTMPAGARAVAAASGRLGV